MGRQYRRSRKQWAEIIESQSMSGLSAKKADLAMKKQALEKLENPHTRRMGFKPSDKVLAFLDSL